MLALAAGCGFAGARASQGQSSGSGGATGGASGGAGSGRAGAPGAGGGISTPTGAGGNCAAGGSAACDSRCGDGKLDTAAGEVCDDGNVRSGDGCSSDCRTIEKDYACPQPGKACTYLIRCGDGKLGGIEQCDPPNVGQGCSADCRLEPGYVCDAPPASPNPAQPASCHKTVCGDGKKEGLEACDDGNTIDGDGCSSSCTLEPDCSTGVCTTKCGDGVKLAPEECDDGNTADGDGCSHDCMKEAGFSCVDTTTSPPPRLNLAVTYRDFISFPTGTGVQHPDFESSTFAGMDATPGLVNAMLGTDGKPVMDGHCTSPGVTAQCPYGQQLTTAANYDQWYRDVSGVNIRIAGTLALARQPSAAYLYDSAPGGFYPLDNKGFVALNPPKETTALADATVNDGLPHNFGFTTEIRYFFQYQGGESLTFSGDDDVWIFVNRRLALDMGGLHPRIQRTLDVDQSAATLSVTKGGVYEIALFHAERHSAGSNFKLTLTGFAPTTSTCRSACGDGVKAANEQCDDGNNVDGDGCSHDCHIEIIIN